MPNTFYDLDTSDIKLGMVFNYYDNGKPITVKIVGMRGDENGVDSIEIKGELQGFEERKQKMWITL